MSSLDHLVDQENRPQGVRDRRAPGKAALEAAGGSSLQHRPVLGEIQNIGRRQSSRSTKSQGSSFSIYCDESASVKSGQVTTKSTTSTSSTQGFTRVTATTFCTKENNVQAKDTKASVRTRPAEAEVRPRAVLSSIPIHLLEQPEPMNTSVTENDSPMVVEQAANQACSSEEQWRVPPIQDNHTVDIFSFPEYTQDIYRHLRNSESKHLPKFNYMAKQTDITYSMRAILVDWLVEVGEEYKLQTETLHLAVNYIDRFLSYMAVQRSKLQLVGAACMFIAAKYEEIYPPDVGEFVYITDDTYNKRQVLRMEHLVLKVLDFNLSVPTTHIFIHKMLEMDKEETSVMNKLNALASYLSELALVDGQSFLRFSPSLVAASSVALARLTLELPPWTDQLALKSGYSIEDLKECFVNLHTAFTQSEASPQTAVREKYKSSKFYAVSELSPPELY